MMNRCIRVAGLGVMLAAAAGWAHVAACGLEGGLGDSFGAAHPESLGVAFAAHDAIDTGLLIPDLVLEATAAHDRGDERLRMLAAALPVLDGATPVAVLLIEPGVWTRLTLTGGAWVVTEHDEGPGAGEVTLIASELAVRDLASGRLTAKEAMSRGLLSVDSYGPLVAALLQAYPDKPTTAAQR